MTDMTRKEYKHQWYLKNKERCNERSSETYSNNKEKYSKLGKKRYSENKDEILSRNKEYYTKNKGKIFEQCKEYVEKNREKIIEYKAQWYFLNKKDCIARAKVSKSKRREQIYKNGGRFTKKEWIDLCERFDNQCVCCGNEGDLSVDHIIPISKGGRNDISNIQPLCLHCNLTKGTKSTNYINLILVDN